jgi:hypothetical protein
MADSIFIPFCKRVEDPDWTAAAKLDLVELGMRNSEGSFTPMLFERDGTETNAGANYLSEGSVQQLGLTHHVKRPRATYAYNFLDATFRISGQNQSNIERFAIIRDTELQADGVIGSVFLQTYSRLLTSAHGPA